MATKRNFRQLKKAGCEVVPRKYFVYPLDVARYITGLDEDSGCYTQHVVCKGKGVKAHRSFFALI